MDTDNGVVKARGRGAGAGWKESMGKKGNIRNTLNNKDKQKVHLT